MTRGAEPPPASQPIMFMNPAVRPRADGGTRSNADAKIFASYRPLKKPQQVSAKTRVVTDDVRPQIATNGAPANMPIAWTPTRPAGERRRHQSAAHPPTGAPARLAS